MIKKKYFVYICFFNAEVQGTGYLFFAEGRMSPQPAGKKNPRICIIQIRGCPILSTNTLRPTLPVHEEGALLSRPVLPAGRTGFSFSSDRSSDSRIILLTAPSRMI
jgi:hypothetical protein